MLLIHQLGDDTYIPTHTVTFLFQHIFAYVAPSVKGRTGNPQMVSSRFVLSYENQLPVPLKMRCYDLNGCCQQEALWPLGLWESALFINSRVNMLLWPKAAAHFHLSKEPGLPGATMSPACEMGFSPWKYCLCSILCLLFSVCSHENVDCLSIPKFCPLSVPLLCPTFSPSLFVSVALSLSLSASPLPSASLAQTVFRCFNLLVLVFIYGLARSTRIGLLLWKTLAVKVKWDHIYSLIENEPNNFLYTKQWGYIN